MNSPFKLCLSNNIYIICGSINHCFLQFLSEPGSKLTSNRFISSSAHSNLMNSISDKTNSFKSTDSRFLPKRALVLGKFSRYDFEKHRNPNLNENELISSLERRGSDYNSLLSHHNLHIQRRDRIAECLRARNIETKVINRFAYNEEHIDWADMIITSGGDGTFLLAASKVKDSSKPLIGVNSDPTRSVGHLCLPAHFSNNFDQALDKILKGDFEWLFRQRIRITLEGENAYDDPMELHDQQLLHPEYRFLEIDSFSKSGTKTSGSNSEKKRILPFRALNEVFIGESLSSRVSYYELAINGDEKFKIKSSGMTICTGTGSTSWSFNINKLTPQCAQKLLEIINEECFPGNHQIPTENSKLVQKITNRFNNSLIFSPSKPLMAYTIRDPIVFGTDFKSNPRDFAKKIVAKSRMTDAHIVIDGGLSYVFNDGARAHFEILEEDALRTIKLKH